MVLPYMETVDQVKLLTVMIVMMMFLIVMILNDLDGDAELEI